MRVLQRAVSRCFVMCLVMLISFSLESHVLAKEPEPPKYVFLFIGDGMSETQLSGAQVLKACIKSDVIDPLPLSFTLFEHIGMMDVENANSYIPDSASSGTALSSGVKTVTGAIGLAEDLQTKAVSIASLAQQKGMKVGLISDVPLNHATPAAFYGHVSSRYEYDTLIEQLAASSFDYVAGGGLQQGDTATLKPTEILRKSGYHIVETRTAFDVLTAGDNPIYATSEHLTSELALPYEIDREVHMLSLADFVSKGIEVLDNDAGFFMMVEGGKIDWAGHLNDGGTLFQEVFAFEKAVIEAIEFSINHPNETLIIVTADHETGGMSLGQKQTGSQLHFEQFEQQKKSGSTFEQQFKHILLQYPTLQFESALMLLESQFGLQQITSLSPLYLNEADLVALELAFEASKLGDMQVVNQLYGGHDPFTVTALRCLNEKAGVGFSTYQHTAHPVSVYATGVGSEVFSGRYHHTDLFEKLAQLLQVKQ